MKNNSFFGLFTILSFIIILASNCTTTQNTPHAPQIAKDPNRLLYVQKKDAYITQEDFFLATKVFNVPIPADAEIILSDGITSSERLTDPIRKFRLMYEDQIPSIFFLDEKTCLYSYSTSEGIATAVAQNARWICTMLEKKDGRMILFVPRGYSQNNAYQATCFAILCNEVQDALTQTLIWSQQQN